MKSIGLIFSLLLLIVLQKKGKNLFQIDTSQDQILCEKILK